MSGRRVEQLPDVCLRRRGLGKSELSGKAAQDDVFSLAVPKPANEWGTWQAFAFSLKKAVIYGFINYPFDETYRILIFRYVSSALTPCLHRVQFIETSIMTKSGTAKDAGGQRSREVSIQPSHTKSPLKATRYQSFEKPFIQPFVRNIPACIVRPPFGGETYGGKPFDGRRR